MPIFHFTTVKASQALLGAHRQPVSMDETNGRKVGWVFSRIECQTDVIAGRNGVIGAYNILNGTAVSDGIGRKMDGEMNRFIKGLLLSIIAHLVIVGVLCLLQWADKSKDDLLEVELMAAGSHWGKGKDTAGGGSPHSGNNDIAAAPVSQPVALQDSHQTGHPETVLPGENQSADEKTPAGNGLSDGVAQGSGKGSRTGFGMGSGSGQGEGSGGNGGVSHYITANYSYILAHIQRQVVYPQQARMMGISGKAVYSFIIRQDGHIDSLSLVSSAGFNALDAAGLKAIQKSAPFPSPPAPARIKVPIVFALQ